MKYIIIAIIAFTSLLTAAEVDLSDVKLTPKSVVSSSNELKKFEQAINDKIRKAGTINSVTVSSDKLKLLDAAIKKELLKSKKDIISDKIYNYVMSVRHELKFLK